MSGSSDMDIDLPSMEQASQPSLRNVQVEGLGSSEEGPHGGVVAVEDSQQPSHPVVDNVQPESIVIESTTTETTTTTTTTTSIPQTASTPEIFTALAPLTSTEPTSLLLTEATNGSSDIVPPLPAPNAEAMDIDQPVVPPISTQPPNIAPLATASPFQSNGEPSNAQSQSQSHSQSQSQPSSSLLRPSSSYPQIRPVSPARIYRTGYIYDPLMMLHCTDGYTPTDEDESDSAGGHPEEPMRIKRIFARLAESGLIKRMKRLEFGQVTMEQVLGVHSEDHWNKVQGTEILTDEYLQTSKHYYEQLSLYVCRETAHCARLSCGGVIQACLSVCKGEVRNAFAIVRPPGHHAEPEEHMGFCFYNNVAVAAKEVMKQGLAKKVLILDWDVHHGNGTQRAFWDDPNVLYISIHRHDGGKFYPTSDFGALDMVGSGEGEGTSVNIPWPGPGYGDADYIYAFQKIVMPIAYEFAPDLVIISAGFDAALGDSLGACLVTPAAYGHMTHMLCALAGGKVVVALEGGYNLTAISESSAAVAMVLLGETPAELREFEASETATEVIYQVAKVQSKFWKSIDVMGCEPPDPEELGGPAFSIPDLLKIHRAHHMFSKHKLFQIPLASPELESAFGGQVICSEGVYEAGRESVLVVFIHDFGNLRVETDGISTTNIHMVNSHLLDTSDAVVSWVVEQGYNIIDVNILQQLPTEYARSGPRMISKAGPKLEGQLIRYIWDNYMELSEAENIILIGHGSGCGVVMELINHREVERKVKAVVQVAGLHSLVRIDAQNDSRRDWFRNSNRIFVPKTHAILEDPKTRHRLGGQVYESNKTKVVEVLNDVLPQIKDFVASKLPTPTIASLINGNGNGHSNASPGPSTHPAAISAI